MPFKLEDSCWDLTLLYKHDLIFQLGYIPNPGVRASLWSGRKIGKYLHKPHNTTFLKIKKKSMLYIYKLSDTIQIGNSHRIWGGGLKKQPPFAMETWKRMRWAIWRHAPKSDTPKIWCLIINLVHSVSLNHQHITLKIPYGRYHIQTSTH